MYIYMFSETEDMTEVKEKWRNLGKSALWAGWVVNTAGGTLEKDEIVTGVTW